MMTNMPTGDGTFWRTDEVLCLNGLIKGRNVDVVGRRQLGWAGHVRKLDSGRGQF